MQVYLNGEYMEQGAAHVSVEDRGFLFADGVYEVIRAVKGRLIFAQPHLERLRRGLAALLMEPDELPDLMAIAERLLQDNQLGGGDATVYLQVTRGAAPRQHAFPPRGTPLTVYVATRAFPGHPATAFQDGVAAITVPDLRWGRCDIKSVALLPNVLANQQAHAAGAFEALFVRAGVVIEGSHSNLFAVLDGELITYPACNFILSGITRDHVLQMARELSIPVREAPLYSQRLHDVSELFLSGTTTDIMPIRRVDEHHIGPPGPIARQLQEALRQLLQ